MPPSKLQVNILMLANGLVVQCKANGSSEERTPMAFTFDHRDGLVHGWSHVAHLAGAEVEAAIKKVMVP